ncbi:MAG: ABC transporter permease [Gemmatimonadota bacterium]
MNASLRDIRLGLRSLRKSPAFTAVCIFALALGIGLTTLMFSIVYGAMLAGLPYPDGDRIVAVNWTNPAQGDGRGQVPLQDYYDLQAAQKSFMHFGGYTSGTMNVSGTEKAERLNGSWVTSSLFPITGQRPALGRAFNAGDDGPGGAKVAVLSHHVWRDRYASSPAAIGQTIKVNGAPYEIVGVMPEDFKFPNGDDLWLPMQTDPLTGERGQGRAMQTVAMLRPDVSLDQANAELVTLSKRLETTYPVANKGFVASADDFVKSALGPEPQQLLLTMLGAVLFVLLIACTNVANLLLDRAAHRSKEVGIRSALGASRMAVMRVFLSEALVLSIAGTVLGIGIAYVGIDIFTRAIVDSRPPFFIQIGLQPMVLLFAVGIALLAALCSGLIPAMQASRSDISETLKDESRGSSSLKIGRISRSLVVFELALSCALLVAAGLMIKSVANAGSSDTGFTTKTVFTSRLGFPSEYTDSTAQRQFFQQLVERTAALPGVQAAALASGLPGAQQGLNDDNFALEGASYANENAYPETRTTSVSPSFFSTLEIPLKSGRLLSETDRIDGLPVVVVNERFVKQHLGGKDAIGRRIRMGGAESKAPWLTIVGVVGDIAGGDPENPRPAVAFRPFAQNYSNFAYITARTTGDPMTLTEPIRGVVASLNPDIPLYWPQTLDKAIAAQVWFIRVFGTMFMIFGLVALFLASVGLYAVMSFSVSRRTHEMGIRMALGASSRDVIQLILGSGARQIAIGLGLGLLVAAAISRVMTVVLFDVKPLDPGVFGGVALVLGLTGALACLLPATRATRVDPADAMRGS